MKSFAVLLAICAYTGATRPLLDGRIVGGVAVSIAELPYQLSLQSRGNHICGASIISANWALTAAHCVRDASVSSVSLRAGSSIRGSGGSVHQASKIISHPSYNPNTMVFDYAVIKVKTPFKDGPGVKAVTLAKAGSDPSEGSLATVSGWGTLSSSGSLPRQLQKVEVPIVGRTKCNEAIGDVDATMICAGFVQGGKDACQGDSGGPLVAHGVQIGVVSWGYGCAAPHSPGVYSNVGHNAGRTWIREQTGV